MLKKYTLPFILVISLFFTSLLSGCFSDPAEKVMTDLADALDIAIAKRTGPEAWQKVLLLDDVYSKYALRKGHAKGVVNRQLISNIADYGLNGLDKKNYGTVWRPSSLRKAESTKLNDTTYIAKVSDKQGVYWYSIVKKDEKFVYVSITDNESDAKKEALGYAPWVQHMNTTKDLNLCAQVIARENQPEVVITETSIKKELPDDDRIAKVEMRIENHSNIDTSGILFEIVVCNEKGEPVYVSKQRSSEKISAGKALFAETYFNLLSFMWSQDSQSKQVYNYLIMKKVINGEYTIKATITGVETKKSPKFTPQNISEEMTNVDLNGEQVPQYALTYENGTCSYQGKTFKIDEAKVLSISDEEIEKNKKEEILRQEKELLEFKEKAQLRAKEMFSKVAIEVLSQTPSKGDTNVAFKVTNNLDKTINRVAISLVVEDRGAERSKFGLSLSGSLKAGQSVKDSVILRDVDTSNPNFTLNATIKEIYINGDKFDPEGNNYLPSALRK